MDFNRKIMSSEFLLWDIFIMIFNRKIISYWISLVIYNEFLSQNIFQLISIVKQ